MLPKFFVVSLLLYLLVVSMCLTHASVPIDGALDGILLYKHGHACSLASPNDSIPFFLVVDQSSVGYLADYCASNRKFPSGAPIAMLPNGVPRDWIEIMKNFALNNHRAWTKLDLKTATEIWGSPKEHRKRNFYTFDAGGIATSDEKNLYHIDLQFDNFDQVSGYRVRGIGICNAKWVIKLDENKITTSD
ncbi:MAG: hypothetical protein GC158_13705 [Cyanobacteria bacterium RI_101]|nr:hypothetical protein [Cyanobacteria bacterium RI_101]